MRPWRGRSECPEEVERCGRLACFIRNILPGVLEQTQQEHGWTTVPRVPVHDKASYMADSTNQVLNQVFSGALAQAGFRSWTGPSTAWLCSRLGDLHLHETVISHIRRLLSTKFVCDHIDETVPQFKRRMQKVQDFMNSDEFCTSNGNGLEGLSKQLLWRCEELKRRGGQRLPS